MLMKDEVLAAYTTHLDEATAVLRVYCEDELLLDTDLRNEQGRRRFENFVYEVLGAPDGQAPPKLISAQEPSPTHFMDKPDNVISLINLESVREVSDAIGMELDPMRFRANFYIDNLTAWQEFDWVGSAISIGAATFRWIAGTLDARLRMSILAQRLVTSNSHQRCAGSTVIPILVSI
jgi:uncharacterized protein YcbX